MCCHHQTRRRSFRFERSREVIISGLVVGEWRKRESGVIREGVMYVCINELTRGACCILYVQIDIADY
jgi:hypothetical protein